MDSLVGLSPFEPIDSVTPFTYRDNATYLSILHSLQEKVNDLIDNVNSGFATASNNNSNGLGGLRTELLNDINQLRADLTKLIEGSHDESIAFDPTNGTQLEGLSTVISRVYDNVRLFAYFAKQYDNLNLTAAAYDALQYTARHFDLGVLYPTLNDVQS